MNDPLMVINDRCIGKDYPTYVVAELGINYNGDLTILCDMALKAKESGADAVKIQMRTPELCVPKEMWDIERDTPWGRMTYINYRHKMELGYNDLMEFKEFCLRNKITMFASVWDVEAFNRYLKWLSPPAVKIPSACITDHALLQSVWRANSEWDLPVIMSIGMSTEEQIKAAVRIYPWEQLAILHCTSQYPCPNDHLDLRVIIWLIGEFSDDFVIGYSNHSPGIIHCPVAVALGANIIEAHFTLDRSMFGSDQAASFEPGGFARMVKYVRATEDALGWDRPIVYGEEFDAAKKLRIIK